MKLLPAIDLMDGQAVRLYQGDRNQCQVYGSALSYAKAFSIFVDEIHIVDLDGAFAGKPQNLEVVKAIIQETGLKIQLGGGFRSEEDIREAIEGGVNRILIGTKALDPVAIRRMSDRFPDKIAVSIDLKGDQVMVEGWEKSSQVLWRDLFENLRSFISWFVFTNVDLDGTLSGGRPLERFWEDEKIIYAGGIRNIDDLKLIRSMGYYGVISGKAIMEQELDLREAVDFLKREGGGRDAGEKNYRGS